MRTTLKTWSTCVMGSALFSKLPPGPDYRNDPLTSSSGMILWSCWADHIPQMPITIDSSNRENMKPNSLLPTETWYKSFTQKYKTDITWLWLNEKCQTDDIYSWHHNGRCDVIHVCRYESVTISSLHAHGIIPDTTWCGHVMFDQYVYVFNVIEYIQTVNTRRKCPSECFPVVCWF